MLVSAMWQKRKKYEAYTIYLVHVPLKTDNRKQYERNDLHFFHSIEPIFTPSTSNPFLPNPSLSFPQILMLIEVQILFVLLGMIKHSSQNEHSWCVMIWSFMSLIYATAWSLSDRFILTSYLNTVKVMEKVWKKGLPNLNELNITAKLFWWLFPVLFFFWFE